MHSHLHETIATVWRLESAQIVAAVARRVRSLAIAEELAQDALVAALERWPRNGIPDNPAAWLMTTAKRRALDHLRHRQMSGTRHAELEQDLIAQEADLVPDFVDALDAARQDEIGDDMLRLMFTACHPLLSVDARVALTLKLLAGLTTHEIARAFLQPEPTIAQRLVRAKRTLSDANVPFEIPRGDALAARLGSVLEVVYLIFNEGYTATSGSDWMRPALCEEALRLARMLVVIAPDQAEVHGLSALLELQASRSTARTDASGNPILLADQDRRRWDLLLIRRGLAALARANALNDVTGSKAGPYQLQAGIAACHARAHRAEETDWPRIASLYGQLMQRTPSPVIALNRAVAVSMADGPAAAHELLQPLLQEKPLQRYHWLHAVHADFLARLHRYDEAVQALQCAIRLTDNVREQQLMQARAQALKKKSQNPE